MRAVILAAGRGRRLAPMGWDKPKCLLPIGDKTLIRRMIDALPPNRIDRITLVVGYRDELVLEEVEPYRERIDSILNAEFDTTNTIHSLYLARQTLGDGFLYFNSDVLFDRRIIELLLDGGGCRLAIDQETCGEEEVKVVVNADWRIERIGKTIPPDQCMGEFIGIGKFHGPASAALLDALVRFNEVRNERNLFFEAALDDIVCAHTIDAVPIGAFRAVEIDTPADYDSAQALWASGAIQ